jgi:hypothetical protein
MLTRLIQGMLMYGIPYYNYVEDWDWRSQQL